SRGGPLRGDLLPRWRRGIEHHDRAERRQPPITPAARLAQRTGAKAAPLDQRGQSRRFAGITALPARQRAVAEGHAVKRRKRSRGRRLGAVRNGLLGGKIAGAQKAKPIDERRLLER